MATPPSRWTLGRLITPDTYGISLAETFREGNGSVNWHYQHPVLQGVGQGDIGENKGWGLEAEGPVAKVYGGALVRV